MVTTLQQSIENGLAYLNEKQLPSGEFMSFRFTEPLNEKDCVFDSSPFPTALIAFSLGFSGASMAKEMVTKAADFLLAEMEENGVWRYWTAQHQYHNNIPPDLDDMACVSSILAQHNIPFPNNKNLFLGNRKPNGLFYTWIVPRLKMFSSFDYLKLVLKEAAKPISLYYFWKLNESKPNDIDAVVNSNVLFYLGKSPETKPIIDYLIDIVKNDKEEGCDKWHLSPLNLQYFLSKNYFAGVAAFETVRNQSIEKIWNSYCVSKNENKVLEMALASCALLNWGCPTATIKPFIAEILKHQDKDGAWPIYALYYGGPKKYFGWGSKEMTTAFCLEALMRYLKIETDRPC